MNDEDSERQRRLQVLTPTAQELAEAMEHTRRMQAIRAREDMHIEMFGRDGDGGRFGRMEKLVEQHTQQITELIDFKRRIIAYCAAAMTAGGVLVAFVSKIIDHFWK